MKQLKCGWRRSENWLPRPTFRKESWRRWSSPSRRNGRLRKLSRNKVSRLRRASRAGLLLPRSSCAPFERLVFFRCFSSLPTNSHQDYRKRFQRCLMSNEFSHVRKPSVAYWLSTFCCGLGQIYCGRVGRGLIMYCIMMMFWPIVAVIIFWGTSGRSW